MQYSQYTPGPWTINPVNPHNIQIRAKLPRNNEFECSVAILGGWDTTAEENQANANIIAAAPDLLHALQQAHFALESLYHMGKGNRELLPYIRLNQAAFKKAGV